MLPGPLLVAIAALAGFADVGPAHDARDVSLTIGDAHGPLTATPVLGSLLDGDVLVIRVTGGSSGGGTVRQCASTPDGFAGCSNSFPVRFGPDGQAYFQYQLHDPGTCGPEATCAVVVTDGGGGTAHASTIFGAPAPPPPVVGRTPPGPNAPGDHVSVVVSSVTPGLAVTVSFCAHTCADPIVVTAGPDGRAVAEVTIGERCSACAIRVRAGAHEVSALVRFSDPPSPSYRPGRLTLGLIAAAVLTAIAWWIIRRTDWTPPSEAATPELDAAARWRP